MPLTLDQGRALVDEGYLLIPGLVPRARVDAALRAVNHSLGEQGIAKDALWTMRAQTFCPELVSAPEILDLYRETGLRTLAEAAIGEGRVRAPTTGQIALRFPAPSDTPPRDPHPHVDGMPGPLNGVTAGTIYHFTALGGVFLSDVALPFHGNFTVWPGTHRALARRFAERGTDELLTGFPPIELPRPRQVIAHAGDAILAHHQLAHGVAANLGPHVRYAVFFRLSHEAHDPTSTATMVDLWREWAGVRALGKAVLSE
ncbi:MAG TPA: phytanoyl-CoA dioxygenase family protein [Polyangia bacterium]|nr:phytanoyl-CoA dioxygenase family protein [Polyangia bacterium]